MINDWCVYSLFTVFAGVRASLEIAHCHLGQNSERIASFLYSLQALKYFTVSQPFILLFLRFCSFLSESGYSQWAGGSHGGGSYSCQYGNKLWDVMQPWKSHWTPRKGMLWVLYLTVNSEPKSLNQVIINKYLYAHICKSSFSIQLYTYVYAEYVLNPPIR